MQDTPARLAISQVKDINLVEFTESRILDEMNINEIGQSLGELIAKKTKSKVLLDFNNVDHLSSAALGMLIKVNNQLQEQSGQLRLAAIRPQIKEVFSITRLDKLFKIYPTRDEAIKSFE